MTQYGGAPSERALGYLTAVLENYQLFAGDEGEYGIGRGLSVFDEVAVDGEGAAVEACEFDHLGFSLMGIIGRERAVNRCGCEPAAWNEFNGTPLKRVQDGPMRWKNAEPSAW